MTSKSKIKKRLLQLYIERENTTLEDVMKAKIEAQIEILVWVLSNKNGELQI